MISYSSARLMLPSGILEEIIRSLLRLGSLGLLQYKSLGLLGILQDYFEGGVRSGGDMF